MAGLEESEAQKKEEPTSQPVTVEQIPQSVTDEEALSEVLRSLEVDPNDECRAVNILMAGKGGSGKTSLANALLTNNSSVGSFGPKRKSSTLIDTQNKHYPELNVKVTVNDIMGFADLSVSDDKINNAILKKCDIDKVTAVVVCFRWDDRFDETSRKILARIGDLHVNIWKKVTFALTHFDHTPPDFKGKPKPERDDYLKEVLGEWDEILKDELRELGVDDTIVRTVQVAPTSHTALDIEKRYYEALFTEGVSNWLENIWKQIVIKAAKYQPLNLIDILSMLYVHLFHWSECTAGKMVCSVKDVQKFFTPAKIKTIFLGGLIGGAVTGAGVGAVSGVCLADAMGAVIGLTATGAAVGAAVGTATVATGGIFAGVVLGGAAIACLVAVVLYAAHRYKQSRDNS